MYDPDEKECELRQLFREMEVRAVAAEKQFCKAFGQVHGEDIAYCVSTRFIKEDCVRAENILQDLDLTALDCMAIIDDFEMYRKAIEDELISNIDPDED